MKQTQTNFVLLTLLKDGYISRNYALKNYITKLSTRISEIKKLGLKIVMKPVENKKGWCGVDSVYFLKSSKSIIRRILK